MARKAAPKPAKSNPAPVLDPLEAMIVQYLDWIGAHNFSEDTVVTRRSYLSYFHDWCRERGLENPTEITRPILERYQRWLFHYRKKNGKPLSVRTQHTRLQAIKSFFQWLARQNYLLHNPASEIVLPRMENRLPKYVMNVHEAEQVIQQPDLTTPEGLRDRAILETFYSTGMRRMELAHLKIYDLDSDRGTVTIRLGKGRKDRIIPIGERALAWIGKYIQEARLQLLSCADDGTVFLNYLGVPFERLQLTSLVRNYLAKSKIGKTGGCHLFRHTVATLMLENGADVRVIQEMLGHAKLTTTELYTRVSINLLKQVYSATHPAAHLHRSGTQAAAARDVEAGTELLATLAAEAEEDNEL
ncbi:MAG TPA: site-specific tyrosine recombinase XerC [Bryobacteraceae bacterium]|nr:site-specific tyrosine recombinase XerC [Bryobacteraceae bacterium]